MPCRLPDELNAHLRTVVVAPMTTGSRPAPFRGAVRFKGKEGLILPEQIRTVDMRRLVSRRGRIDPTALKATLKILQELFAA